ncbi:MAG: DMT family transporter [Thermodesulfobacteriota bacterium]
MEDERTHWLPIMGLVLAMLIWGSSFIALKLAFRSFDPMVVIFGRMFLGSLCLIFFYRRFRGILYRKGDLGLILLMAFCEPCLYFLFEAFAVVNTTASQAGMITAILPLLVAVSARVFLKEHISRRTLTGFLVAIAGTVWLSAGAEASTHAPRPALGNFLEFTAMVCATGYVTLLKKLSERYTPLFLTAAQAFVGTLFYLPILFLPTTTLPARFDPGGLLAIAWLGTFVTCGAYGLYNYGLSRIPASQASAFVNLIPVFAVVLGWLILDETFTLPQYLASILVFLGVFLSHDRRRRPAASEMIPGPGRPVVETKGTGE